MDIFEIGSVRSYIAEGFGVLQAVLLAEQVKVFQQIALGVFDVCGFIVIAEPGQLLASRAQILAQANARSAKVLSRWWWC